MNLAQDPPPKSPISKIPGFPAARVLIFFLTSFSFVGSSCNASSHSEFVNLVERMLEDERVINDFYCECGDEWSCNEDFEERDPEITASCFQTALDQIEPKEAEVVVDCYDKMTAGWRKCLEELDECEPDVLDEDDPLPCSETWSNFFWSCELDDFWPEELDNSVSECIEDNQ